MAIKAMLAVVVLMAACANVEAISLSKISSRKTKAATTVSVNPIRKVVNLLKGIEAKVNEEIAAKKKLYDEYMCYCKTSDGTLAESISAAEVKIPKVASKIEEDSAKKNATEIALKESQSGREAAKEQIAEADKLRASGAETFDKASNDLKTNIAALSKAIPAIEKGMAGAFLQTSAAATLQRISVSNVDISPSDRDLLTSFLTTSGEAGYVPQSGEIVGILKTIKDEMEKELAEITADEEKSVADYEGLVAAKKKEIAALTKGIESKLVLIGDLGVGIAEAETDLEDTKEALAEDQKFLADLGKNCDTKTGEWEEFIKMSNEELVALTDTIKVLNEDDALEIFKKTLPAAGSSFLQFQRASKFMLRRTSQAALSLNRNADPRFDLIQIALQGGQMGFEKVIKMIDELMATLKKEQADDDEKKTYCLAQFDESEDKKKELERDMSDLDKSIADGEEAISTLKGEIADLAKQVKELDKQVAEATELRKEEHATFTTTVSENKAAKEILEFALNRLYKFYKPNLYIPPAKVELAEFAQMHAGDAVAPPPPPEADLAYKKKEGAKGVIAMIELIIKELAKENLELEGEEKGLQAMYEKFMADAAEKRAELSKTSVDKEAALAEAESDLMTDKETLKGKETETMELAKYVAGLHSDCDWLLKYHEARMIARTGELESLDKAKAVLSGADYS